MRTGHSLCHRRNTLHEVSGRQPRFARRTAPPCELNFRPNRFISLIGAGKEQTAWITSFSRRPAFPFFLFSTRSNDFVLLPPTTPPTLISASRHSLPSAACCIHIHLQSLHPPRPQSPHCQTNIPSSQLRGKQVCIHHRLTMRDTGALYLPADSTFHGALHTLSLLAPSGQGCTLADTLPSAQSFPINTHNNTRICDPASKNSIQNLHHSSCPRAFVQYAFSYPRCSLCCRCAGRTVPG